MSKHVLRGFNFRTSEDTKEDTNELPNLQNSHICQISSMKNTSQRAFKLAQVRKLRNNLNSYG